MKNICLALLIVMSVVSVGYAEKFTIAVLPDTQCYTRSSSYVTQPDSINIFKGQTQFIADNKTAMNIVFVAHMGDVVNDRSDYTSQWTYAVTAMTTLKNANIPMGMCAGNHDFDTWTDYGDYKVSSGSTYWNNYFGASTSFFSGKSWYGGAYSNGYDSTGMTSWQTFTAGGINFLYIVLELYPRDEVLAWASDVIAAHPGYSVIVATHSYMHDSTSSTPKYQSSAWRTGYSPNNGQEIWDEFIKVNPQIIMVLSGHECYCNRLLEENSSGGKVLQMLADFQSVPSDSTGDVGYGAGWMRFIEFDTTAKLIHVRTYSSLFGKYSTDPVFTDGSAYARRYAPFNYADGSDLNDSNKGDGDLLAMSDAGSNDFYIVMDVNTAYQGTHITGLYKAVQMAPEYGYYGVGGITFDPTSTGVDGNYNKIYWCNRVDQDGWQGIYSVNIYDGTYSDGPLALGSADQPYDITVNAAGTYYVCNSISPRVYSVTNIGTSSVQATRMLDSYDMDGDDDPVSVDMVPTGFGGGYDEGVDIVLFDNGVNVNEDEAIFILDSASLSTSELYTFLWEDGTTTSNNDIRGAASSVDGYAYFARMAIPSDVIGTSNKCYINRIKGDGVLQRVFMSVNGETIASSSLDDAIAINPVDGSVWLVVYNYGGNADIRAFYRVDAANATLISGNDYIATTTLEFLGEYNIGVNSMAFSPDGKFLAVASPSASDIVYVYSTMEIDTTPANCTDALNKGYKLDGDFNSDCAVNFADLELLVGQWLECFVPGDAACSQPWE